MGLLDDAIREHLELKRRRGADSSEVARQEQEAFGPPRRGDLGAVGVEDHEHDHEPALDEPAAFAAEAPPALQAVDDLGWEDDEDEPPAEAPTRIHSPRLAPDPDPDPEPVSEPEPLAALHEHREEEEPEPPIEREAPAGSVSASRLAEEGGQRTREFDSHELRAATEPAAPAHAPERHEDADESPAPAPRADEDPDEDADVLEETPEFLQETPEHDRLWFEQRPPRDFDF